MSKRLTDAFNRAQAIQENGGVPPHATSAAKHYDPKGLEGTSLGNVEPITDRFNSAASPNNDGPANPPSPGVDRERGPGSPTDSGPGPQGAGSQMVKNDAPRFDMHPPEHIRSGPTAESYNARLNDERAKSDAQIQEARELAASLKSLQNPQNQAQYDNDMGDDHG